MARRVPLHQLLPHVPETTLVRIDIREERVSGHDLIAACCGNKNSREAYASLARMHATELKRLGVESRPLSSPRLTPTVPRDRLGPFLELCLMSARIPLQRKLQLLGRETHLPLRSFTEVEVCHRLAVVFSHLQPEPQKPVESYRIDLYLHLPRVAIECDENSHRSYGLQAELRREHSIVGALDCLMVRFDPYDPAFSYEHLLHRILMAVDMQLPRITMPTPQIPVPLAQDIDSE